MKIFLSLLLATTLCGAATAQSMMERKMPMKADTPAVTDHSQHKTAPVAANAPASTKAFVEVNDKMHKDMAIQFSGDADVDFVRGMIPHHQGAIDMAKVVLAHGKDAEIRKLAEDVIKAQTGEIAMMNAWLAKNAK